VSWPAPTPADLELVALLAEAHARLDAHPDRYPPRGAARHRPRQRPRWTPPKLDAATVAEVRRRHAAGDSHRTLARAYRVAPSTIGRVLR
jgi:hypothetical protein